ncbi:MAG: 3-oxoadipate enol-lactonase [Gammaproteobacteria bacterium]|jgi:3-oxoadipate enol-lactonase
MALIHLDDIDINVRQWGRGDPLILIHGLGTNSGLWIHQVREFSEHYRVVALDLRGFGRSAKPEGRENYSIEIMAQDVIGICASLGLESINYLGSSMGGFIGQELALRAPQLCRRIILAHTASEFAIPEDVMAARLKALDETTMDAYAALVVKQALAQPPDPIVEEWLSEMIADNQLEAYKHVLAGALADFNLSDRIHKIRCPTLVIAGSDDRVLPPAGGRQIADQIIGSEFHLVDGVGHIGYAEKPAIFNQLVLDFLSRPS